MQERNMSKRRVGRLAVCTLPGAHIPLMIMGLGSTSYNIVEGHYVSYCRSIPAQSVCVCVWQVRQSSTDNDFSSLTIFSVEPPTFSLLNSMFISENKHVIVIFWLCAFANVFPKNCELKKSLKNNYIKLIPIPK